jgi:hypothetical protein
MRIRTRIRATIALLFVAALAFAPAGGAIGVPSPAHGTPPIETSSAATRQQEKWPAAVPAGFLPTQPSPAAPEASAAVQPDSEFGWTDAAIGAAVALAAVALGYSVQSRRRPRRAALR